MAQVRFKNLLDGVRERFYWDSRLGSGAVPPEPGPDAGPSEPRESEDVDMEEVSNEEDDDEEEEEEEEEEVADRVLAARIVGMAPLEGGAQHETHYKARISFGEAIDHTEVIIDTAVPFTWIVKPGYRKIDSGFRRIITSALRRGTEAIDTVLLHGWEDTDPPDKISSRSEELDALRIPVDDHVTCDRLVVYLNGKAAIATTPFTPPSLRFHCDHDGLKFMEAERLQLAAVFALTPRIVSQKIRGAIGLSPAFSKGDAHLVGLDKIEKPPFNPFLSQLIRKMIIRNAEFYLLLSMGKSYLHLGGIGGDSERKYNWETVNRDGWVTTTKFPDGFETWALTLKRVKLDPKDGLKLTGKNSFVSTKRLSPDDISEARRPWAESPPHMLFDSGALLNHFHHTIITLIFKNGLGKVIDQELYLELAKVDRVDLLFELGTGRFEGLYTLRVPLRAFLAESQKRQEALAPEERAIYQRSNICANGDLGRRNLFGSVMFFAPPNFIVLTFPIVDTGEGWNCSGIQDGQFA
ncbi:hypothetical protein C8J56DRAFT_912775 [Mycena floridula]|nr:hypothetical protein C8J56DRAFT_912775 [Mycena floridula]